MIKLITMKLILQLFPLFFAGAVYAQTVDGGNGHTLILDKQGHVWTSGRNNYGQLGDSSLKNAAVPKKVQHLPVIAAIARGYDHSIALPDEDTLAAVNRRFNWELLLKALKYQFVLLSVSLNVVLFRKLRGAR